MSEKKNQDIILSQFFDKAIDSKALSYNILFDKWSEILLHDPLAEHCYLKEIEKRKLILEFDHPGWIQIFKMREKDILSRVNSYSKEFDFLGFQYILNEGQFFENKHSNLNNVYDSKSLDDKLKKDENLDSKEIKSAFNSLKILFDESRKS